MPPSFTPGPPNGSDAPGRHGHLRLLITAGPTHEPIDQVRFIGNRSSGRLGIALADSAAARGWPVTLLLGPTDRTPSDSRVRLRRFRTVADLHALLAEEHPTSDVLVMAAAVADYRVKPGQSDSSGKLRRSPEGLTLHLEPTPDLLAGCAARRRPGQLIVGFALEPRERLMDSARSKLGRKGLDLIVANPLETMDSPSIEAIVLSSTGEHFAPSATSPSAAAGAPAPIASTSSPTTAAMDKDRFALWLLDVCAAEWQRRGRPVTPH